MKKTINHSAPVKCSKSISINAAKEKVWTLVTNIDNWADWQTDISDSRLNGELKPHARFQWKSGGAKIHSTLHTMEPHTYFGWTGRTLGLLAIHNWTLSEKDGLTEIIVDESMEGFMAGLLKKSLNRSLEKGMQTWLDLIKKECEE